MVRPIEITDALSKVQVTERIQQNLKATPEAVQQFQKELSERLADEQVTVPQPPQPEDQIILHEKDEEKDQRKEDGGHPGDETQSGDDDDPGPDDGAPSGHIDIRA